MKEKIRILHLWNEQREAECVVRTLAETGIEFEAKLVRTEAEYVSALLKGLFHLIIIDSRADFGGPAPGDLSAAGIARELAPKAKFARIEEPDPFPGDAAGIVAPGVGAKSIPDSGTIQVPRNGLNRLGEILKSLQPDA